MNLNKSYSRLKLILKYSDVDIIEIYQSSIMIFINPFNLIPLAKMYSEGIYMHFLGWISVLIGLFTLIASVRGGLRSRIFGAELHMWFCSVIVSLLLFISHDIISTGIISFYILQLCFSLFCLWRLTQEQSIRIKDK